MLGAARQSFISSAAICALLGVLFAARYALAPYPVEAPLADGMPLAAALTRFSTSMPVLASVCGFVIVVWTLMVVVQLTVKYAPAQSRNYLPPQIFLIGATGCVVSAEALASLMAAWLLVLAMRQFVFSFHKGYRFAEVFRAGFYMGLLPLLYAPMAFVAVLTLPFSMAIYRRSVREAVVCSAGMLLPVPAAGFIHLVITTLFSITGTAETGFTHIFGELWRCSVAMPAEAFYTQIPVWPTAVAAGILLLAGIAVGWSLTHRKNVRRTPYKFMQHVSLMLMALIASAALPATTFTLAPLVAITAALAVPYAFSGRWATVSSVLYCLILAAVFAIGIISIT